MTILFAAINRFRDAPGAVPKTQYILGTGPGGGDGMNFATGSEIFQWNSESVPYGRKPRRIITLWVDASQLSANSNVILQTAAQKILIPAGSQGYVIVTMNAPFTLKVTASGTGLVNITAYDYNANYTGTSDSLNYSNNQSGSTSSPPVAAGRRAITR